MAKRQLARVSAELLVWARQSINMSVEDAAAKIGVQPDQVAQWESGQSSPSIPQLRAASKAYKRPLAAFFLPSPPADFHVPHDFRRKPGQPAVPYSASLAFELRQAQERRQIAIDLADEDDLIEFSNRFIGTASLADDAEAVAATGRKLLRVPIERQNRWKDQYEALNAWKDALEQLGILVFHFVGVDTEEARGFSISDMPFPVVAVNGSDAPNGRIFSLMHEFAHLMLGEGGSCDLVEHTASQSVNERTEVFCNRFAGAVLVPQNELMQDTEVSRASGVTSWTDGQLDRLAKQFRVSRIVVLRRLLILGRTGRTFFERKHAELVAGALEQKGEMSGFLSVPRKSIRCVGQPFARIVLNAYYRQAITSRDVSDYLGVRLKHLPSIELLLAGSNVLTGGDR